MKEWRAMKRKPDGCTEQEMARLLWFLFARAGGRVDPLFTDEQERDLIAALREGHNE